MKFQRYEQGYQSYDGLPRDARPKVVRPAVRFERPLRAHVGMPVSILRFAGDPKELVDSERAFPHANTFHYPFADYGVVPSALIFDLRPTPADAAVLARGGEAAARIRSIGADRFDPAYHQPFIVVVRGASPTGQRYQSEATLDEAEKWAASWFRKRFGYLELPPSMR
jgi:hypothetical protein